MRFHRGSGSGRGGDMSADRKNTAETVENTRREWTHTGSQAEFSTVNRVVNEVLECRERDGYRATPGGQKNNVYVPFTRCSQHILC